MNKFLKGAVTTKELHKDWMKDPKYKKAHKELDLEFQIIKLLINLRIKKKYTQHQLAKKLGITQPVISKLESGNFNPSVKFLRKIAKGLDAKLEIKIS